MNKICPSCNEQLQKENNVCHKCGYDLLNCNPHDEIDDMHIEQSVILSNSLIESETEYVSVEVEGVVEGEHYIQTLSDENYKVIEKLKEKQKEQIEKEDKITKKRKVVKILWIIFCGVFNAVYFAFTGFIECIFVVGIPFGIVLFKMIPLAFNPIGKRVKLNFYKRPFFNLVWLFLGGWFIACVYEIFVLLLFATVIGIPYALQMQKVAKYLWSPFGAQVLNEDEFSDHIVEKVAYTVQYLRRNKIVVDDRNIDFTDTEKSYLEKIYKIDEPVNQLFLKKGKVIKTVFGVLVGLLVYNILKNNIVLLLDLIIYAITKGAEPSGFLQVLRAIYNFSLLNFVFGIINHLFSSVGITLEMYLKNIPYFSIIKTYLPVVFILSLLALFAFLIIKANNKKQEQLIEIDYGYATKKQLVDYYDNGNKINEDVEDALVKIYAEYKVDVDKEIEMNKEV